MFDSSVVLTVFWVYLAGVVVPGPNFVAVVHKAVAATRAEALALVAGIVTVNLLWSGCAITGLGLVFAAFPWAVLVVKIMGAAYLMWFGVRLIIKAGKHPALRPCEGPTGSVRKSFFQGVVTNIGNPKSIAFYAAVFSAASPAPPLGQHLRLNAGGCGGRFANLVWTGCGQPLLGQFSVSGNSLT